MLQKTPRMKRRFEGSIPLSIFSNVLEHLRGTPARLEDRLKSISPDRLRMRDGNSWSIQDILDVNEGIGSVAIYCKSVFGKKAIEMMTFDDEGKVITATAHYTKDY